MKRVYLIIVFLLSGYIGFTQSTPFFLKGTLKENRQQLYRDLVKNIIIKNLSLPLTDSIEESWQDAFIAMELISYKSAWADTKIHSTFDHIANHSIAFQRALLELAYTNYPGIFFSQIKSLLLQTKNAKIFAMCAVYILAGKQNNVEKKMIEEKTRLWQKTAPDDPILIQLKYQLQNYGPTTGKVDLQGLFNKNYLHGNTLLISFQRKNRDYPGLIIVRDKNGNFIQENNQLFFVPQLARSISNLPGYLTNGNTPEGIFRMTGFDTSKSNFIGPTTNIQLRMAFEDSTSHFYNDSTEIHVNDINDYKKLLPIDLEEYFPLYESYYASEAGRTEIIAHGTTIDPSWYKNKPYYPLTPTQGCLCTREIWDDETGRLFVSDQQRLVNAIIKAGGPDGYAIVINIDDQEKPVELNEIMDFLQHANKK